MQKARKSIQRASESENQQASVRRSSVQRIFELDGAHVVLCAAAFAGTGAIDALAARCRNRYFTLVIEPPRCGAGASIGKYARTAESFDRVIVCEGEGAAEPSDAARALERAVRSAGRVECNLLPDSRRALRHCIDGLVPGDVVAYCCENVDTALAILEEYGARESGEIAGTRRTDVAPARRAVLSGAAAGHLDIRRV